MGNTFFSEKHNRVLATLVLLAAVVALAAYAYQAVKRTNDFGIGPTTINVSGTGEVVAIPDVAQFSFSVRGEGDDAAAAQEESGTAINEILAYLKEAGVEDRDIKTQGYNMYPKYRYEERFCGAGMYCPPGEQIPDGFEVNQTVSVKVRDTDNAGTLLSGVGERGATDISGLNFTIDDEESLKADARSIAIEDAQAKAALLAEDLGVRIVRMIGYYEESPYQPYYGYDMAMSARAESAAAPSFDGASIPTGEGTITTTVNLTFEIK